MLDNTLKIVVHLIYFKIVKNVKAVFMNYYKGLYIGDTVNNHEHIIELLYKNIYTYNIYVICVKKKIGSLLTIVKSKELFNPINNYAEYIVVGLANGRQEAIQLTQTIIFDYYSKTKNFDGFKESFY